MTRSFLPLAGLIWLILAAGCARYQYSVVAPAEEARMIERRGEAILERDQLEYGLRDLDRSLGIRIANLTDEPVTLLGERSFVVDPTGQTHPMQGGTIAPHSFIAFAIPPAVRVYEPGPRFGVGLGMGRARGGTFIGTGVGTTIGGYHGGPYVTTLRPWEWRTGDVRLRAVYDRAGERLEHDFVLRRERVQ
jgi:hypothetical protein